MANCCESMEWLASDDVGIAIENSTVVVDIPIKSGDVPQLC